MKEMKEAIAQMGNPTVSGDFVFILGRTKAVTGSSRSKAAGPWTLERQARYLWRAGRGRRVHFFVHHLLVQGPQATNGSTEGGVPVSMAYMFHTSERRDAQAWDRATGKKAERPGPSGSWGPAASASASGAALGHSSRSALRWDRDVEARRKQLRRLGPWATERGA